MKIKIAYKNIAIINRFIDCSLSLLVRNFRIINYANEISIWHRRRLQSKTVVESAGRGGADLRGWRRRLVGNGRCFGRRGGARLPRSGRTRGGATAVQAHSPQSQFGRSTVRMLHRFTSRCKFRITGSAIRRPRPYIQAVSHSVFPATRWTFRLHSVGDRPRTI